MYRIFIFQGGPLPLVNPEAASDKAATVLQMFRRAAPTGDSYTTCRRGHPFIRTVELTLAGEKVITKKEANGFNGTNLLTLPGIT
jgi:hypothetical protein